MSSKHHPNKPTDKASTLESTQSDNTPVSAVDNSESLPDSSTPKASLDKAPYETESSDSSVSASSVDSSSQNQSTNEEPTMQNSSTNSEQNLAADTAATTDSSAQGFANNGQGEQPNQPYTPNTQWIDNFNQHQQQMQNLQNQAPWYQGTPNQQGMPNQQVVPPWRQTLNPPQPQIVVRSVMNEPNYIPVYQSPTQPNVMQRGYPNQNQYAPQQQFGGQFGAAPNPYQGQQFNQQGNAQYNQQGNTPAQTPSSSLPYLVKSADGHIMMQKPQGTPQGNGGTFSGSGYNQGMQQPPHFAQGSQAPSSPMSQHPAQDLDQKSKTQATTTNAGTTTTGNANAGTNATKSQSETTTPQAQGASSSSTQDSKGATQETQGTKGQGAHQPTGAGAVNAGATHSQVFKPTPAQPYRYAGATTTSQQYNEKWYDNLGAHICFVALITLLLLIPASFFSWLLSDRESNQTYAVESMTAAWGEAQSLSDPEIIIPVMIPSEIEVRGEGSRNSKVQHSDRFIRPKQSVTNVDLVSEKRYKGNYEATLYTLQVTQTGFFDLDAGLDLLLGDARLTLVDTEDLRICFNVEDNKGIDEIKAIEINGRPYEAVPSDEYTGFEIIVPKDHIGLENRIKYNVTYMLRGSQLMKFYPLAQVSELHISAQGAIPNFSGSFLPREREVNVEERTFKADYYQNNISTGQAIASASLMADIQSHIIIELFDDADSYILIDRLTKYVLLVIAMTFVTVLAFEIVSKRLVSLVQYVVIGVALLMFYLVLLSFSEHFSFVFSYILGALTLSLMISLYIKAVFDSKKHAVCLFIMLLAMYAVLFAIVHIEAYALLVGTILLVIMLGVVMYITRHINQKPVVRH